MGKLETKILGMLDALFSQLDTTDDWDKIVTIKEKVTVLYEMENTINLMKEWKD